MDSESKEFTERKMKFILTLTAVAFEEKALEFLKSNEWSSLEELDAWFDENMKMYDGLRRDIRGYYIGKMYS